MAPADPPPPPPPDQTGPTQPPPPPPDGAGGAGAGEPLIPADHARQLQSRWEDIQTRFVDEPQTCLQEADQLVDEVIDEIRNTLQARRAELEGRWSREEQVPTEQLRRSLQRYRQFLDQLLSTD